MYPGIRYRIIYMANYTIQLFIVIVLRGIYGQFIERRNEKNHFLIRVLSFIFILSQSQQLLYNINICRIQNQLIFII